MEGFESVTFRQQELDGAQVTLAGRHHEEGPALFVADVDVGAVLQQELGDLGNTQTRESRLFSFEWLPWIQTN